MEAPDKIYVTEGMLFMTNPEITLHGNGNKIEYTRTDAFIEKVDEFFSEHLWEYINVKNANCDTFINIDCDKLKEAFKKYMKGE